MTRRGRASVPFFFLSRRRAGGIDVGSKAIAQSRLGGGPAKAAAGL